MVRLPVLSKSQYHPPPPTPQPFSFQYLRKANHLPFKRSYEKQAPVLERNIRSLLDHKLVSPVKFLSVFSK